MRFHACRTPNEIDRRRGCIADLRRSKNNLSRMLNGKDTYGSINREELYSSSGGYKNRNSWAPNQYEDPNTREKDTRSLLRQQEQMMAKLFFVHPLVTNNKMEITNVVGSLYLWILHY